MSSSIPPVDDDISARFSVLRVATEKLTPSAEFLRHLEDAIGGHAIRPPELLVWSLLERQAGIIVVASSLLGIPVLMLNILLYQQLPETVSALLWDVLK